MNSPYLIRREGKDAGSAFMEAIAAAEAQLNNVGAPGYQSALLALEKIKFVLRQEGDMSVIAPAYKKHLLDIIAEAKV